MRIIKLQEGQIVKDTKGDALFEGKNEAVSVSELPDFIQGLEKFIKSPTKIKKQDKKKIEISFPKFKNSILEIDVRDGAMFMGFLLIDTPDMLHTEEMAMEPKHWKNTYRRVKMFLNDLGE